MPALGRPEGGDGNVGLGVIPLGAREGSQEVVNFHRNRERDRMMIPDMPEPVLELSEEQKVYIYNVSPWRFQQELASYGTKTIPALDEAKVLQDLYVAGPLVIDGIPFEFYPAEGEAKVIYHRPQKNRGRNSKRPGWDFAMEVIGKGMMVNPSCDLTNFGVFVSEQVEQRKPEKDAGKDAWNAYNKWVADVKAAQGLLRQKCAKMCEEANTHHSRGKFGEVSNEGIYQAARLIKKTEVECPWLKDTSEAAQRESCPGCGQTVKMGIIKCQCGYRVCSDETWEKVKGRYA